MLKCVCFLSELLSGFLKSKGSFRTSFDAFLLFLRPIISDLFLEWKFIEFSGLFHCLIIKVLFSLSHISDLISLTHSLLNVNYFFKSFWNYFLNCFNFSLIFDNVRYLTTSLVVCQHLFKNIFQKVIERRWRDLNPRAGRPTYTLSRGASSATWVHLQSWKTRYQGIRFSTFAHHVFTRVQRLV